MPRNPIGPRPLTPAERQAHQRQKRKQEQEQLRAALRWIIDYSNDPAVIREARAALQGSAKPG